MDKRPELFVVGDPEPGKLANLAETLGSGMRYVIGTILFRPDHYLYPNDVREKATQINNVMSALGRISTDTLVQRQAIVCTYQPRQVTGLIRNSSDLHWKTKPGFYAALASRITEKQANIQNYNQTTSWPTPVWTSSSQPNQSRPNLRLVKNED